MDLEKRICWRVLKRDCSRRVFEGYEGSEEDAYY